MWGGGLRFTTVETAFYYLFISMYYFSGGYGLWKIRQAYLEKTVEKTQLGYILVATIVAFSASFVYFPSVLGVKVIPLDNLILGLYVLIMFYAIFARNLMDFRVVIRKGLIYSCLTAIITFIYLALVYVSEITLKHIAGYSDIWLQLLTIFTLVLIFQALRSDLLLTLFLNMVCNRSSTSNKSFRITNIGIQRSILQ